MTCRKYFRWQWLRLLRLLGSNAAADSIRRQLEAVAEINTAQGEVSSVARRPRLPSTALASGHEGRSDGAEEGMLEEGGAGTVDAGVMALSRKVSEAVSIKALLEKNTDEVENLLRALDGSYVKPGVGGEKLRIDRCVALSSLVVRRSFRRRYEGSRDPSSCPSAPEMTAVFMERAAEDGASSFEQVTAGGRGGEVVD